LAQLLSWHGQRRGEHEAAAFALRVEGEVRPLHAAVLEESFAIGREAINNAYLHAQARHIEVVLAYGERYFELTVRDDGKGLPAGTEPSEPGHWGVAGMRERAGQIGAVLTLITALGEGASWSLRMPARIAYAGTGARALTPDAADGQPDQERDHADA
jgi:signal transduction histidine kinase